ncbi:MAG: hypothetical protein ACREDN_07235 [Aestuariivirga sp.]
MYVTTNSALVWKRMADENQQSAKYWTRISMALAVLLVAVGAYALSAHARYNELCTTIQIESGSAKAGPAREFGESLASTYCG